MITCLDAVACLLPRLVHGDSRTLVMRPRVRGHRRCWRSEPFLSLSPSLFLCLSLSLFLAGRLVAGLLIHFARLPCSVLPLLLLAKHFRLEESLFRNTNTILLSI